MQRARPRLLKQLAEQVAVEPRDGEPLRATRRSRNDVDVLDPQPAFADQIVGVATGKQGEGTHALNGSMPRGSETPVIPSGAPKARSRGIYCAEPVARVTSVAD